MADASVTVSDADGLRRKIDNESRTNAAGDEVFQQRVVLGGETNYVSPTVAKKTADAKFFIADSGQRSTTVTDNWINATIENPAGSGKNLFIVAVTVETDQTAVWAKFYRSPTTNLPTTARTAYNGINLASTGPFASAMTMKANAVSAEMDGATDLVARITSNVSVRIDLPPLIVTAGTTLGFGANLGGAGNGSVAMYWFEDAA